MNEEKIDNRNFNSENDSTHTYDNIINLPHHVSKNHPRMPMINRAAQFAPFAALSGFEEAIDRTEKKQAGENSDNKEQKNVD